MYKYYYTLDEIIKDYITIAITHNAGSTEFEDVCDNLVWHQAVPSWAQSQNNPEYPYLEECWLRVRSLFQRDNTYFGVSDEETDDTDKMIEMFQNRLYDLYNTFYTTKDRYINLIKAQEDLKSEVLNDLVSTNETWFNDTPQMKGDYTDLDYASNYTRNKQSVTLGPVSAKLEEVDKALSDIYDRWVAEFYKFRIFE